MGLLDSQSMLQLPIHLIKSGFHGWINYFSQHVPTYISQMLLFNGDSQVVAMRMPTPANSINIYQPVPV